MSLKMIEQEVRRFLSSPAPEVLCISGRWGVGKTYGWNFFLREAVDKNILALDKYSYVSLFGANSVDGVKYEIFQNAVSGYSIGRPATAKTVQENLKDMGKKSRPVLGAFASLFGVRDVFDVLAYSTFLMVRDQVVCFDDLERAGDGLGVREVLGLASVLRDERSCKVVILMNEYEYSEKEELYRQLEKAADVTLRFDPAPEEAAEIALPEVLKSDRLVKPLVVSLGITNIRVIRKIARMAARLIDLLPDADEALLNQSVATLVLAAWSMLEPATAPALSAVRKYNALTVRMLSGRDTIPEEIANLHRLLEEIEYPFDHASDIDNAIIDGIMLGYFDDGKIKKLVSISQNSPPDRGCPEFTRVWNDLYWGSLAVDENQFFSSLISAAMSEAVAITPLNINGAITVLRENGRSREADHLIEAYVDSNRSKGVEFFTLSDHFFAEKPDPKLVEAFAREQELYVDERNPLEVLVELSSSRRWGVAERKLFERQGVEEFVGILTSLRGAGLRDAISVLRVLMMESDVINANVRLALREVAGDSKLAFRKIAALGFDLRIQPDSVEEEGDGEGSQTA